MEKIKVRRSLYIGLGGTGMNAILHTKKIFADTYPGKKLQMIGYLGIDTNEHANDDLLLKSKDGDPIVLEKNEWLPITVNNAFAVYTKQKDLFKWLPEENLDTLNNIKGKGAGQFRSNGRFIFSYNADNIEKKIKSVLDTITNAQIGDSEDYEIDYKAGIDIHVVFSVCGGTGCGTFIDLAYLLRKIAKGCKINGYAVLPDVFEVLGNYGLGSVMVKPNAYGAIEDLDWLMHLNPKSEPVTFKYSDSSSYKTGGQDNPNPFDSFIFIDNENENGDTYKDVSQLAEMISLFLFSSSGELTHGEGVWDNVQNHVSEMKVKGKKAWIVGIGACEIFFRGLDISRYTSNKSGVELIRNLINSSSDKEVTEIANNWINETNIDEHTGNGVIDSMFQDTLAQCNENIVRDDEPGPMTICNNWIENNFHKDTIEINREKRKADVINSLNELIEKNINQQNGIGNVKAIISKIQANINTSKGEMATEKAGYNINDLSTNLETACSTLGNKIPGIHISTKKIKIGRRTNIAKAANSLLMAKVEIAKRDAAIDFFNNLSEVLSNYLKSIETVSKKLDEAARMCEDKAAIIKQELNNKIADFQINLAKNKIDEYAINENELIMKDFISSLENEQNNILNFESISIDDTYQKIINYVSNLQSIKKIREMTIDDIIDNMNSNDFEHLVEMSIHKSEPLLRKDYRGEKEPQIYDAYYIAVHQASSSRFNKDSYFKNHLDTQNVPVDFQDINAKDRILIYRIFAAIPAFAIKRIDTYKEKYDACDYNCHFDKFIEQRMKEEDYSIEPKDEDVDALELWVKGQIFGLIINDKGKYKYIDKNDKSLTRKGFWKELTASRPESFNIFKDNIKSIHDDYINEFNDRYRKMGAEEYNKIIDDMKSEHHYLDKFMYTIISSETLDGKIYKDTSDLATEEENYVKDKLKEE